MSELIPRQRRTLAAGAVHLPGWLDPHQQRRLVAACRQWASEGPGIRAASLPNGARMSVRTVCLGWHWYPYRYSRTRDDQDGSPVTPFPGWLGDLGRRAVSDAYLDPDRGASYAPDVALINYYDADARMGLHRDSDEKVGEPIVSLSLGAACVFRREPAGLPRRPQAPTRSGDTRHHPAPRPPQHHPAGLRSGTGLAFSGLSGVIRAPFTPLSPLNAPAGG